MRQPPRMDRKPREDPLQLHRWGFEVASPRQPHTTRRPIAIQQRTRTRSGDAARGDLALRRQRTIGSMIVDDIVVPILDMRGGG